MALEADEDWMTFKEKSPEKEPVKVFTRRRKILNLDDLVADSIKEKKEKAERLKRKAVKSLSDDEDDNNGDAKPEVNDLIEKCSFEVVGAFDIQEAPRWGERVFAPQNEVQECGFSSSAADSPRFFPAIDHDKENQFIDDIVANHVITTRDRFDRPELLSRIFKKLARSQDPGVQRDNFAVIRDYFLAHKNTPGNWKPTLDDIREAFNFYGYQPANAADDQEPPPARDMLWLIKCLLIFSKARLFQDNEIEELLPLLCRCMLDRSCLQRYNLINDCIEQLLNDVSPSSIPKIASSLARLIPEPVNIYHILKLLRKDPAKVDALRREVAFEVMSAMDTEKLECNAHDVVLSLDEYDVKGDVDFVKIFYHLCLADLWLRNDPEFKPGEEAFTSWMEIIRGFSVKIFCGDYRPLANEVRNRAAFLVSCYGLRVSD